VKIIWTAAAREDLQAIRAWLDMRNQVAAGRVIREIRETVSLLNTQAMLGRVGQIDGTRELVVQHYPYLVIYEVLSGDIRVLSVFHTSRAWWLFLGGSTEE
jgi:addiction module RelE/StbE family toxin